MNLKVLPPDVNYSRKEFMVAQLGYRVSHRTLRHLSHLQTGFANEELAQTTLKAILRLLLDQEFSNETKFLQTLQQKIEIFQKNCAAEQRDFIQWILPEFTVPSISLEQTPMRRFLQREARIDAIRFGLSAVKNVGGNAVDTLLKVREKSEGRIKDLLEFMKAIDLTRINKRMLETLVKCGAFDSIQQNRAQLFQVLDKALHLAQEFQKSVDETQISLFDLMETNEVKKTETQLEMPVIRDWSKKERLKLEKESLGFYVSGHPLDSYHSEICYLAKTTADLVGGVFSNGDEISLAGIIVGKTIRLNKNSEKFAIICLEDLRGTLEMAIYTHPYAKYGELLEQEEPLLVHGKVVQREEDYSLLVDEIHLLSQVREEQAQAILIAIDEHPLTPEQLKYVRGIFQKYPGERKIEFHIKALEQTTVKICPQEQVMFTSNMVQELEEALQQQLFSFQY